MFSLLFIALVIAPALIPMAMRPSPVRVKLRNR